VQKNCLFSKQNKKIIKLIKNHASTMEQSI
jgi:hypothetical protein